MTFSRFLTVLSLPITLNLVLGSSLVSPAQAEPKLLEDFSSVTLELDLPDSDPEPTQDEPSEVKNQPIESEVQSEVQLEVQSETELEVKGETEPETDRTEAPEPASSMENADAPQTQTQEDPTRLVLRLRERRVYVVQGDRPLVSYPVAIGKAGWETPVGQFKVLNKIPDPVWRHPWNGNLVSPGPSNPLGRRWIGFWSDGRNMIGFHGTIDESLIGQAVSHGCVRMKNADVAALFEWAEEGMLVTVEP